MSYIAKMEEVLKGKKLVFMITGGGTRAISLLLENGGASSIFEGSVVAYSQEMFDELFRPSNGIKYCSPEAAKLMLGPVSETLDRKYVICAMTCSLMTENEREGREHKCFIAIHDTDSLSLEECEVKVVGNTRKEQEDFVASKFIETIYLFLTGEHVNVTC